MSMVFSAFVLKDTKAQPIKSDDLSLSQWEDSEIDGSPLKHSPFVTSKKEQDSIQIVNSTPINHHHASIRSRNISKIG